MNSGIPTHAEAVARLCNVCGLCCNGVLFGDVELRSAEDPGQLGKLGLELFRKGTKLAFRQPCRCWKRSRCVIYENRPERCRTFDCALLKRVVRGDMTVDVALKRIAVAKRDTATLKNLVRALGHSDENIPLKDRCAEVMMQPIRLSVPGESRQRGKLMRAAARLGARLVRDFLAPIGSRKE